MASKYAGLKGQIPVEVPSERDQAIETAIEERRANTLNVLTAEFNLLCKAAEVLAKKVKAISVKKAALQSLIIGNLGNLNLDSISTNGYTWSTGYEPYPVCDDVALVMKYFKEHEMEDQLVLKKTEVASRLANFVKDEAMNNELVVVKITVETPDGPVEKTEVRSKIPGVKVYLDESLSRTKSSKKGSLTV